MNTVHGGYPMIDPITQYILDEISYHDREYVDQREEERRRQMRDRQKRREEPSRWNRRDYGRNYD